MKYCSYYFFNPYFKVLNCKKGVEKFGFSKIPFFEKKLYDQCCGEVKFWYGSERKYRLKKNSIKNILFQKVFAVLFI